MLVLVLVLVLVVIVTYKWIFMEGSMPTPECKSVNLAPAYVNLVSKLDLY